MTPCQNCGAALRGPYCAVCGQRHDPHVHSLGHFAAEAAETLTHADSRLWRSVATLLRHPGRLTRDFFAGRRASQLPPFRLYLVVSVAFFIVAAALPSDTPLEVEASGTSGKACEGLSIDTGNARVDGWLRPRVEAACRQADADGGRGLGAKLWATLPRAMFVLMPVMAGLMMLLYWRPRRRYVEHLLLFVHNHTAAFLAIGLQLVAAALLPAAASPVVSTATAAYLAWYVFRSMRVYYGQGFGQTLAKYVVILMLYSVLAGLLFTAAAAWAFLGG